MRNFFVLYVLFWLAMLIGYVMNIVKLCQCDFSATGSWKAEIIHGIGVVTGLGGILGWFNFGV